MSKLRRTFLIALGLPSLLFGSPGDVIVWTGATSSDLTNSDNWDTFNVPTNGTEADFDNTASNFTPTVSSSTMSNVFQVDLVKINTTGLSPGQYSFFIQDPGTFFDINGSFFNPSGVQVTDRTRGGGGIPVNPVQNFYIDNSGTMIFQRNAIADIGFSFADFLLPPFIVYNLGSSGNAGFMQFTDSSQAGAAGFNLHNGSQLLFDVTSLGVFAQINLDTNSNVTFTELSNANAAIITAQDSSVLFDEGATAFLSTINLDNSTLDFRLGADVQRATVNATNGSVITVQDNSETTGRAVINLTDSSLTYKGVADGGQSEITASNSDVHFLEQSRLSSLAILTMTNNSTLEFIDQADAGIAKINVNNSQVTFGAPNNTATYPNSSNAFLQLSNSSIATFNNNASLLGLNVLDASSILNFNNFLPTPMIINSSTNINNGQVNINPDPSSGIGPVVFRDAFNTYPVATVHRGILMGNSLNLVGDITNFGTIIFQQNITQAFRGTINGPGIVIIQGGGTLSLEDNNPIQASIVQVLDDDTTLIVENDTLRTNVLALGDDARVNFEIQEGQVTFSGLITDKNPGDHGIVSINQFEGNGTFMLSNPANNYSGGTTLYGGTLQINNAVGVPGLLSVKFDHTQVVFNQTADGTYNGMLDGYAIGSKIGLSKLTFPANSVNTLRSMVVQQGEFQLNGSMISPRTKIAAGSILSGTGSVTGELEIFGTLAPGNSQSAFTVIGELEFEPGSTYHVFVDGAGNSTHVNVTGPADDPDDGGFITIEGGTVVADVEGSFDPNKKYTILSATSSLTGKFTSTVLNDPFFRAIVTYDPLHAYLQLQNAFTTMSGTTFNQRQVLKQLAKLQTSNSNIREFLSTFLNLPEKQALHALNQMCAQQYSHILSTAEGVNERFIRRLYNPLREINAVSCGCDEVCCSDCLLWDTWADASFDRTLVDGNRNTSGFKSSGYELSLGVQTTLSNCWTLGLAGTYEEDYLTFNIGGRSRNQTSLGALYALYRPEKFYILGDLILGYSTQKVHRPIEVHPFHLSKKGRPELFQSALYGEVGLNYCKSCIGIQPFIGLEVDYFNLNKFHEKGDQEFLSVHVKDESYSNVNSRLGVHLTATPIQNFLVSLDLAWQCRLSSLENHLHERFIGFGDQFYIKGVPLHRNSIDGTFNIGYDLCDGWEFYAEAAGQWWKNASFYDILAGVNIAW